MGLSLEHTWRPTDHGAYVVARGGHGSGGDTLKLPMSVAGVTTWVTGASLATVAGGGDHQGWVRSRRDLLRGGAPSTVDGNAGEADETRATGVTAAAGVTAAVRAAGSKVPV